MQSIEILQKLKENKIIQGYIFSEKGKHILTLNGNNKPQVLLDTTKKTWYLLGEIAISQDSKCSRINSTLFNQIIRKNGLIGHFDMTNNGYIYNNEIPHFLGEDNIIGVINISLLSFEFIFESLNIIFKNKE